MHARDKLLHLRKNFKFSKKNLNVKKIIAVMTQLLQLQRENL